jgi:DNA-binding winged helix-turn-helix (wHTH) protein
MAYKNKQYPYLLAQSGPLQGQNWEISDVLIIGREIDSDIVVDDRQVSRSHAKIHSNSKNEILITDMDSKNGTFLNGERVTGSTSLKDGDVIKIALIQEFMFVSSDATLPLAPGHGQDSSATKKLFVDQKARRIWVGDKELVPALSVSQYKLLVYLIENEGNVLTREDIVKNVWGEKESLGVTEQALDALIRRLRDRLNKIDPTHEYIITLRGVGFKLENDYFS